MTRLLYYSLRYELNRESKVFLARNACQPDRIIICLIARIFYQLSSWAKKFSLEGSLFTSAEKKKAREKKIEKFSVKAPLQLELVIS